MSEVQASVLDNAITVQHARTHNLRDVSVEVPKHQLTVVTGVSGSGKSSLVFDTIAAEAHRLVTGTYPAFVRSRLAQHPPADVDRIDGLTFTSVVDQRPFSGGARSTVGTASDIAPMIRLLFSRIGRPSAGYSPAYSFNDPAGMCPQCEGLGYVDDIDLAELVDPERTLRQGPIRFAPFAPGGYRWKRLMHSGLADPDIRWAKLEEDTVDLLLNAHGLPLQQPGREYPKHGVFDGVLPRIREGWLRKRPSRLTQRERDDLRRIVTRHRCPECAGARLNQAARDSHIGGQSIADWYAMPIRDLRSAVRDVTAGDVAPLVTEISKRLESLDAVGLGYLSLDRESDTLSGGEAQRLKIVRNLDSALSDVTYVFDEPTSGLHPSDVHRLLSLLVKLREGRNTVIVMEHHPTIIDAADHIIDLGPRGGSGGGHVQFCGTPTELARTTTATGRMLREGITLNRNPRASSEHVTISDAHSHNLQHVSIDVPLQVLTVVTGVAGSGKSSLFANELAQQHPQFAVITQGHLHGGSRSTPATVLNVGDSIRNALAATSGRDPSWFTANGKGACPTCKGRGYIITDLAFLDDVHTPCDACCGTRFNPKALQATIGGHNIAQILAMPPDHAIETLSTNAHTSDTIPPLRWMTRVGLDYLTIGQTVDTLSGGERQRLLLAKHLAENYTQAHQSSAPLHIVLDEPTRGLHHHDATQFLALCNELVDNHATVILIEHNQHVIAAADHVFDIGPGSGRDGGAVVFHGPPEKLINDTTSVTGRFLRSSLRHTDAERFTNNQRLSPTM